MAKKPLRALILEDCEDDALLIVRELGDQGFDLKWERVWTAPEMKSRIESGSWDVVLSDYNMPEFDAPSALQILQETGQNIPFIVISGTVGEVSAVAAMKKGAHDYLMKGNLARLGQAIEREMRDAESRRNYRQAVEKIEHLNRVLRAIRNVNKLIVTEKDGQRLLERAMEMLVETRGYTSALCIHLIDDEQQPNMVAHCLASGESTRPLMDTARANGLTECMKRALETNKPVILESDAPECVGCPFDSYYPNARRLAKGLVHEGNALGALTVVQPESANLDTEENDLLDELSGDIAFALHGIEIDSLHQESQEKFRIITESSPDAIFITDREGKYVYVNAAASALLGYSVEELTKMSIVDISVEGQQEESLKTFQQLLTEGKVFTEIELVHKNGKVIPVDLNSVLLPNGQVFGSCRDLTERRRADRALKASETQYRRLFESAKDGILILDADSGEIIDANPFMTALTGYSHANFLDKHLWEIGTFKDIIASKASFAELQAKRYVRYDDLPLEGHDGQMINVEFISNVYNVNGRKVIQCNIRDITEMKKMRAQIAQSDRLSSMGMLAAGVAHEINNPLSYVLYNLESLGKDLPDLVSAIRRLMDVSAEGSTARVPETKGDDITRMLNPMMLDDILERFKDALEGTTRIRGIARGLGTFSRVEKDRLVPVSLMQVIEVAVNMAFNEIKYRARLVKDYGKTPVVMASEGRLSQVFLNLIINATHAIDEGDVDNNEIRVRTWSENGHVCAEVRDTGKGIPPANMDRLFEPFFTTKKIGVGSGLGLAISKNIVESYGGTIGVQSKVGKGTCFTVRFPARAEDEDPIEAPAESDPEPEIRGRILIVDDEDGVRSALVRMLHEHETVQAANGAEAKRILEKDPAFDLILCDMMMSDMSGMDLHEWLTGPHPALARQLIFMTGGAFTPRARDYLGKVGNIRLEKPFDTANLKKIIAEMMAAGRARKS